MLEKKITKIQFGVLSKDDILRQSVAEVNNERVYEDISRFPTLGGVNDPRMGTVHRDRICITCHSDSTQCSGHFGHISLAKPVYHVGMLEHVRMILKCVCLNCSKLLVRD